MDLRKEVDRLRLDVLAVELSCALRREDVPHVILKGPSTSNWLYSPPRPYRDVDLLVPLSQVGRAASVLSDAGLATSRSGGIGEEAAHSWLLHSTEGFEIDLHISLPAVPARGDRVWQALASHVHELQLDVGTIPELDAVGRCLVLALHSVGDAHSGQSAEDLRRARSLCGDETWDAVVDLASSLGVVDLVDAGLSRVEAATRPLSRRARLYLHGAPEAALGIERLATARRRDVPQLLWREFLPTRGFMTYDTGQPDLNGWGLFTAHVRRWRRLARSMPAAVRALRSKG